MSKEGVMPDLVQLTRQSMEASNRREFDVAVTRFASSVGLGRFEGPAEIHGYLADWMGAYEQQEMRRWEGRHLGSGVVFVTTVFDARLRGSTALVHERWSFTVVWAHKTIKRVVASQNIDEARVAAERLAAGSRDRFQA
jgi:hypothetical protein